MDLTVSIVTYNSEDTIEACLKSISGEWAATGVEVFVVDNASRDSTVELIRRQFPQVTVIQNGSNEFFSAHNHAIRRARGRYTAILNPDIVVDATTFPTLIGFLEDAPDVVAVAPAHRLPDGQLEPVAKQQITPADCLWVYTIFQLVAPRRRQRHYERIIAASRRGGCEPITIDVLQDSCMVVRTGPLRDIGGYDATLKLYFTEDDLCLRLARFGKCVYWPSVEIRHAQSTSVKKESPFRIRRIRYYDMLQYLKAYYGAAVYLAFLPITYLSIFTWWLARAVRASPTRVGVRE